MFSAKIIKAAQSHAKSSWPNESVGVVADGQYRPLANISENPGEHFAVSMDEIQGLNVQALIHSHPFTHKPGEQLRPYPSAADMAQQIAMAVPWAIAVCDAEDCAELIWFGDEAPRPPLLERPFRHGVTDCYALVRDYYREELGIHLMDFPRDWDWWNQDSAGEQSNLYETGFARAGFRRIGIDEVRPGDMFLAKVGLHVKAVNHGGVYLGGSGDLILHHLAGSEPVDYSRPAVKEPGARYLKYVTHWLRHEEKENG